jgi:TetR/AcrR family transcriptional repressor of nem operon
MRYSKEHKDETRRRIVAKAAVRLREKGLHGIGVADLMKEVGLTHGGFYAHFESREALVIEAITRAMDASIGNWNKLAGTQDRASQRASIVEAYLSPQHRDATGHGCAVPSLGADILREGARTKRAFAAKIEEMVAALGEVIGEGDPAQRRAEAVAAMASMVGALLLSRLASGELSDEFLQAGRRTVLGTPDAPADSSEAPGGARARK